MNWLIVLVVCVLTAHAFAHLPGFVIPWQLMTSPEMPYKTTVLAGHLNVGPAGIRIVGLLWLAVALLVAAAAVSWVVRSPWAAGLTILATVVSLATCLVELPQAWIGVAVNVGLLLATPVLGATAWRYTTDRIVRTLQPPVAAEAAAATSIDSTHRAGAAADADLPAPVARYFARVLSSSHPSPSGRLGGRRIVSAELEQEAEFFVGGGWKPLRAVQHVSTEPPGFLWDARIAMMPGVSVLVRDSYIRGRGSMDGEVAGIFPVVKQSDRPELDAGALHRYVAEAVWVPTALWPGPHLRWSAVDDEHAQVTFQDGRSTVRLQFRFTPEGDVAEIVVPDRPREEGGRYIPTPWTVRCDEYGTFDGMRIPVRCEVAWQLPTGPLPYWRGRITRARYATEATSPVAD